MMLEKRYVKPNERGYSGKQTQVGKTKPCLALALEGLKMTSTGKALIDLKD